MSDPQVNSNGDREFVLAEIDQPVHRRGSPIAAWAIIVVIVLAIVLRQREIPEAEKSGGSKITNKVLEFQGQYLVAAASLSDAAKKQLYDQAAQQMNTGPVSNRLRFVVIAGELAGPDEARKTLEDLHEAIADKGYELTEEEAATLKMLATIYSVNQESTAVGEKLSPADENRLTARLGWHAKLALTPEDGSNSAARAKILQTAKTTMIAILSLMGFGFLLAISGVVISITFVILAWTGKLQAVHGEISPSHGIYIEAFAVWLLLHQIIGLFAGLIVTETNTMVVSAGGLMVTGIAAFWPVVRGVTWKQMCADIGLHRGTKNWLFEIVFGMVGYVTMLPSLLLNGLILILVMKLMSQGQADEFAMPQMPSHPLNEWVTESGWFAKFMIIFLASGVAPVLEETMFRGFLYRHLRDACGHWRPFLSIAVSALFSSFIFAVIHPQGWIAVPALTTTAIGFCLLREWRGSLIAPMTAHALHNGVATVMIMIILGAA